MNIIEDLKQREIIHSISNEDKILQALKASGIYVGFDPTAKSLHLGNYVLIVQLKRFAQYGIKPLALIGGATGMIGDPSGKSKERLLLKTKELEDNKQAIIRQLEKFGLDVVDNLIFYQEMNVLTFLRDVGKLININYMLGKDVVASRLNNGISFTEFSYQLMQGWDFKCLYEKYNVHFQLGGSDQWGNITTGLEVIRKQIGDNHRAAGLTTNLLTTASGAKFGKSAGNALWLDPNLTSPYQLYQYLFNSSDQDALTLLKWLTLLPLETINEISVEHQKKPANRLAQKHLAQNVVEDIHGQAAMQQAERISKVLFMQQEITSLQAGDFKQLANVIPTLSAKNDMLLNLLIAVRAIKSKREGREFLANKAIVINGLIVQDENYLLKEKYNLIRRGKKNYYLIILD